MESLFTVNTPNAKPNHTTPWTNQENRILDPKKAQNIAILLRALNVTVDEVCEALLQGNYLPFVLLNGTLCSLLQLCLLLLTCN